MADNKLIGQNYTPPDLVAKVTGTRALRRRLPRRRDAVLQAALSPMPHARVRSIDASAALAMPGVQGDPHRRRSARPRPGRRARADQRAALPGRADPRRRRGRRAHRRRSDRADRRRSRAAAVRRRSAREPAADGAERAARRATSGARRRPAASGPQRAVADQDAQVDGRGLRRRSRRARCRWARRPSEWAYGDLDAGFKNAALVLDETFVVQSTGHQPMETRSAMAYWQNGKLYLHGSTQSVVADGRPASRAGSASSRSHVVLISEYTGGGFGSKGGGAVSMAIPALLSKKANAPVMMRISREEEHYIGRARTGMTGRAQGRLREGRPHHRARPLHRPGQRPVRADGRSPIGRRSRRRSSTSRWRCAGAAISVLTNTPPRSQQRSPGPMQANGDHRAGRSRRRRSSSGIDQVAIRQINSPDGQGAVSARRGRTASAAHHERVRQGGARPRRASCSSGTSARRDAGKRRGSKVRGVGVAVGPHGAGSIGFDGLMTIRPDGKLYVQSGVGNLGTHSVHRPRARRRRSARRCRGRRSRSSGATPARTSRGSCLSVGSQTTHAMTRANLAGAMDAKRKLQEIAAKDLGGSPDDYELGNERVYRARQSRRAA